jgi:CheY-like chemotaxis protein
MNPEASSQPPAAGERSEHGVVHVLVIEDDARLAGLVAEFLTSRGMLVDVAGDGARSAVA